MTCTSLQGKLQNVGRILEDLDHTSWPIRDSAKRITLLSSACFLGEMNRNEDMYISRLQMEPVWVIWLGGGSQCQRTGS